MATILINTVIPMTDMSHAIGDELVANMDGLGYTLENYSEKNFDRFAEGFPGADKQAIWAHINMAKRYGHFTDYFISDILPVDTSREKVRFIFGKFSDVEWERLKLLGAVMVADYSQEGRIDADVFPIIDNTVSFAYILADIAKKVLKTDLRYTNVQNARVRLQEELAEIVFGGI